MKTQLDQALAATETLWPPLERAYRWLHAAARLLANHEAADGAQVQRRMRGLLGALTRWQAQLGELSPVLTHFMKVTRSYWSGRFHCYDVAGLPRTNNDLEQLFGRYRHIERRGCPWAGGDAR